MSDLDVRSEIEQALLKMYYKGKDGESLPDSHLDTATQALLALMDRVRIDERKRHSNKKRYSLEAISKKLGISRPTLTKWLDDPEQFTLGAIKRLQELEATNEHKDK